MLFSTEQIIKGEDSTFTVVTNNRSGIISKVAGVLALNGLGVFGAAAHTENSRLLTVFRVERKKSQEIKWELIEDQAEKALAGRLAVAARLGERSRFDQKTKATARPVQPRLTVDNETSEVATVLEISCLDEPGILYRITRAFTELDLDIDEITKFSLKFLSTLCFACIQKLLEIMNHLLQWSRILLEL